MICSIHCPPVFGIIIGTLDELIQHGLLALRECLPSDAELTAKVRLDVAMKMFLYVIHVHNCNY